MPGMDEPSGTAGSYPALAVVLALFMLGYIAWTTDLLTSLAPGTASAGMVVRLSASDRRPSAVSWQPRRRPPAMSRRSARCCTRRGAGQIGSFASCGLRCRAGSG